MPSIERHPDSRRPTSTPEPRPIVSTESTLSEAQLRGRCQQLRRKLSGTQAVWRSGRLACLAEALQSLEDEMRRRGVGALQ